MTRWPFPLLVAFGLAFVPRSALAAGPNKLECIAANDAAQDLRRAGKLREAREELLLCGSPSCPGLVREDCAQRLADVDRVMPSLVFEAKDGVGNALVSVAVTMDGQRLTDRLAGQSVQVDPGEHRLVFESAGLPPTKQTIVVHEGERDRHESVVLGQPVGPAASPSVSSDTSLQRLAAFGLGGAGVVSIVVGSILGLVSKSNYDHALQTECGNNASGGCSPQGIADGKSAHGQAAASTVAFVVGGALLATGAALYFTVPKTNVSAGATAGPDRAGLMLTGAW